MFDHLEEKSFRYWNFIMFIISHSVLFALFSSFFSNNMTWDNVLFLIFVLIISAILGMSPTYYFINNKSFESIIFNKLVLVAIIGLVPSIIIGILLTYLSAMLI
ncbi:hypothetical protein B8A39_04425 [Dolosigranulum pigrum]|nr:hypothetical protein B8A39_04425 [Dolosigranulum pigrum]